MPTSMPTSAAYYYYYYYYYYGGEPDILVSGTLTVEAPAADTDAVVAAFADPGTRESVAAALRVSIARALSVHVTVTSEQVTITRVARAGPRPRRLSERRLSDAGLAVEYEP